MKLQSFSRSIIHTSTALLALSTPIKASPLSALADIIHRAAQSPAAPEITATPLEKRQGGAACGFFSQTTCFAGETCSTDARNWPTCVGSQATAAPYRVITTIWTETGAVTKTSIYTSWGTAAATPGTVNAVACNSSPDQSKCGQGCCNSGYWCMDDPKSLCAPAGNGGFTTAGVGVGTIAGRPTTISGVIVTQTISPTTTIGFQTATPISGMNQTSTGGSKLSGGPIAGIVIGVLLGVALLFLICVCCCLKAGFDGVLAIFGLGKKKRSRRGSTVIEEEGYTRHHRHGASAAFGAGAMGGRRWHGSRSDSRDSRYRPPPKKSGWGSKFGALAAGLGTAALVGAFRKKSSKRTEKSGSSYTGSSYDYSYSYSGSSDRTRSDRHTARHTSRSHSRR